VEPWLKIHRVSGQRQGICGRWKRSERENNN